MNDESYDSIRGEDNLLGAIFNIEIMKLDFDEFLFLYQNYWKKT